MHSLKRIPQLRLHVLPLAAALFLFALSLAQLAPVAFAQSSASISQGFTADTTNVAPGALVSVRQGSTQTIELADTNSAQRLLGVVGTNPLLELSSSTGPKQVQVVINGTTNVLVSDINGPVRGGDRITASPIKGIGMRATASTQVVGVTQGSLDTGKSTTQSVKDRSGKAHDVHIGQVAMQVSVSFYQAPASSILPPFLLKLAEAVAGKPVSVIRVLLSALLLFIATASIFVMLYSSTRSGITSLGRNPLAAKAIQKGLLQSGAAALLILAFTLIAIYLMLTA